MNAEFTYNTMVAALNSLEDSPLPDGLDGLNNFEANNGERRHNAGGSEQRQRARVNASILGVDADRLARYVGSFLRRVPAENRWHHQDDLEQSIWALLYQRRQYVQGNFELVKLVARDAYTTWYSAHAKERQLNVEAVNRAISLERAYQREHQERPEGIGHDIPESRPCGQTPYNGWVGWEDALIGNVDATRLFQNLPESMSALFERKSNGSPANAKERKQLSRWLQGGSSKRHPDAQTNRDIIGNVLRGTHVGPIVWYKAIR
jgi:hypothetical protein